VLKTSFQALGLAFLFVLFWDVGVFCESNFFHVSKMLRARLVVSEVSDRH